MKTRDISAYSIVQKQTPKACKYHGKSVSDMINIFALCFIKSFNYSVHLL